MSFLQFAGSLVNFGGTFVKGDVAPVIVLPPMTLRFKFSKAGYDPTVAGVGSAGTWRNVSTTPENIWDWTNANTNWQDAFRGAFPDEDNEVSVIAAGDTSAVIDFDRIFAGVYTSTPNKSDYKLTARNNIVDCVNFDISGAPNETAYIFCGSALRTARLDLSKSVECVGIYADTLITEVGDVDCGSTYALTMLFSRCPVLKSVGAIKVSSACINVAGVFNNDRELEYFGGFIGDTSSLHNFNTTFQNCKKLCFVANPIDLSAWVEANDLIGTFNGCNSLRTIPFINMPSTVTSLYAFIAYCGAITELPQNLVTANVTDFRMAFRGCSALETIPSTMDVSSATNVQQMFMYCYGVKYGILEMYHKLLALGSAITNHTDCFTDCGRDTAEGRAALAQIPQDWGGTMAPPPEPPTENYFQLTNRGASAESLTITSGGNGTVFVDGAYAAQFNANSPTSITVPSGSTVQIVGLVPRGTSWASGTLSSASGSSFSIDRFDESLENPAYLFCGWTGLTSVTSWTGASEYTGMTDTFADCSSLTTIPSSWNGLGNVTTMTDTFNETGLTAIPDSWAGLDNVTNMSNIFENCSGIVTGGSTGFSSLSKVTNADAAFSGCSSWTGDAYGIYEYLSGKQIAVTNHNNTFNGCIGAIGYSNIWETWGGSKSYNPLNLPSNTIRIQMVDSTVDPTSWEGTWSRVSGTTDTWDCTYPYWSYLFDGKSSIKRVLGANGTGVTGMAYMFRRCTSLESIVPFDTSSASSMVAMFSECSALTTVAAIDTSNATSLYQIFYKCSNLTTVPAINAHSATSTSYAFYNCSSLTSVQVTSTENVTNFDSMFRGCTALTAVPPIDTSHAANLDMFLSGCSSLDSVPIFDTSNATSVGGMLSGCSSLTTVPLFDTGKATYMASMLSGCSSLTAVPLFDTSKATNVSGMLSGCRSLNAIPLFDTSNATNMSQFVSGCSSLISVPLFDTSNATNMFGMLSGCSSLTSIPLFDTSKATEVSAMLSGCSGLTTVPLLDISSATEAGSFLSGCSSLTVVPLFDTSNLVNMAGFMKDCTSITSLPLFDTGKAVYVHEAFKGCTKVETGALALYQQMSTQTTPPTSHDKAFFWCGINTVSGQAELNQIPQDWGGTMPA